MDTLMAIYGVVGVLAFVALGVLAILMPVSAYLAQKYAKQCRDELVSANAKLAHLSEQVGQQQQALFRMVQGGAVPPESSGRSG